MTRTFRTRTSRAFTAALSLTLATSVIAPTTVRATTLAASDATATVANATRSSAKAKRVKPKEPLVEFEIMTWPEVKQAMADGKKTALFYTGGTEQRGPQNANGGHNLIGKAVVKQIALALGNAIAMPVLPYTPNNASAALPGTIGLTPELLGLILERLTEQAIVTGFTNVVLMGDHGGGQPNVYAEVAKKLDAKYAPQNIHVYYCDEVYAKAQADFDAWLKSQGYPSSSHAGIPDTSTMLFLGGDVWVRKELIKDALGDPVAARGAPRDPNVQSKNNGITGDARRASKELGKRAFELKVAYGVKQIRGFLGMPAANGAQ